MASDSPITLDDLAGIKLVPQIKPVRVAITRSIYEINRGIHPLPTLSIWEVYCKDQSEASPPIKLMGEPWGL